MTTKTHTLACFLLVAALASGCGASVQMNVNEVIVRGPTRGERYEAALRQTLDAYEAEVGNAHARTYPTFAAAYETSQRFGDPDLTSLLEARLAAQGLTLQGLNQYAAEHPEWVRAQNRIYRERTQSVRGTAFAIMARYERDAAVRFADEGSAQAPAIQVAGRKH